MYCTPSGKLSLNVTGRREGVASVATLRPCLTRSTPGSQSLAATATRARTSPIRFAPRGRRSERAPWCPAVASRGSWTSRRWPSKWLAPGLAFLAVLFLDVVGLAIVAGLNTRGRGQLAVERRTAGSDPGRILAAGSGPTRAPPLAAGSRGDSLSDHARAPSLAPLGPPRAPRPSCAPSLPRAALLRRRSAFRSGRGAGPRVPPAGAVGAGRRVGFAPGAAGFAGDPSEPLRVDLPWDGAGEIAFHGPLGFEARVREVGAAGAGRVAGHAVAYRRAGGASFWTTTPGGVEEWLHLAGSAGGTAKGPVAVWRIEGARVRARGGVFELVGADGAARVRVTAPAAFAPGGGRSRPTSKRARRRPSSSTPTPGARRSSSTRCGRSSPR